MSHFLVIFHENMVHNKKNAKPSHTAAVWSIHNLATRRPHAVLNYSPVLTAAVCYVLTEKATVITTNLYALKPCC